MKHTELRAAVLDALEKHDTGATLFDGRPAVFDEEEMLTLQQGRHRSQPGRRQKVQPQQSSQRMRPR
ncbi:phage tail terminator protein, partial [Escherichia coli]